MLCTIVRLLPIVTILFFERLPERGRRGVKTVKIIEKLFLGDLPLVFCALFLQTHRLLLIFISLYHYTIINYLQNL